MRCSPRRRQGPQVVPDGGTRTMPSSMITMSSSTTAKRRWVVCRSLRACLISPAESDRQDDVCTGTEGGECEVVCHEVSQRGAARSRRWRARPKADLDHAAPADGAQIDAMTGKDCVALAIIGGSTGRGRLWGPESGADALRAWRRGRRSPGSRSDGCGGSPFGRTWSRKRRMNSSASSVITLDLLLAR